MGIKAAITGRDDGVVLSECERGEDSAVASYREALGADLPAPVRAVIERQFSEVRQAHDRVRNLEKSSGAGA
jgi:uncharacterized protein (TIGR02284 family)